MIALLFGMLMSLEEPRHDCQLYEAFEIKYTKRTDSSLDGTEDNSLRFQMASSNNQLLCTHIVNILMSDFVEIVTTKVDVDESPWLWYRKSNLEVFFYQTRVFAIINDKNYAFDLNAEDAYRVSLGLENHLFRACLNDMSCRKNADPKLN